MAKKTPKKTMQEYGFTSIGFRKEVFDDVTEFCEGFSRAHCGVKVSKSQALRMLVTRGLEAWEW